MRRPTFNSSVDQPQPATDKESRLSKVKRIITGGILLGRKKKESEGEKENSGENEGVDMGTLAVSVKRESAYGHTLKQVHIEVAASATTEIVLKPRKRKERLDSGGSINQDTKVIRSSSEERPEVKSDASVRRVWSHEELGALVTAPPNNNNNNASNNLSNTSNAVTAEPLRELNLYPTVGDIAERSARGRCTASNVLPGEELEARRSSERFSKGRCAAPRRRKVSRRALPPERSPSPSAPKLDVSSLHKQMEGGEPITSRGKVLSPEEEPESPTVEALISPRNSLVMRLTYLDPNLPPSPPQTHLPAVSKQEHQERRLTKQINSIKRQLKRYEEGFRIEFGYKPSQADKSANKDIKRLCADMARLKTQLNQLREENSELAASASASDSSDLPDVCADVRPLSPREPWIGSLLSANKANIKSNKTMEDALMDVEKKLQDKRVVGNRSSDILEMSREQLLEEKLAVQKALLGLENTFGRPVDPIDRDMVRPLYQRYRALKRLVIRSSSGKLNNSANELATILEHEAMEFTPAVSVDLQDPVGSESGRDDDDDADVQCGVRNQAAAVSPSPSAATGDKTPDSLDDTGASSSSSDSLAENLHALPLSQLLELQKRVKEDKKRLRRSLREFEEQFQSETGRRPQKQDRLLIETIYLGYKQAKAKLRLLEALIAKKSQVKRNSC